MAGQDRESRRLPSPRKQPRTSRTRKGPFAEVWPPVEVLLQNEPGLQAKTVFDWLEQPPPAKFEASQGPTWERRVPDGRVTSGPTWKAIMSHVHKAGDPAASDFTDMSSLGLTIAGQTAPGDGITLKNGSLIPQANHLIVRYIRVRLGEQAGPPGEVDAVSIYCPLEKENPNRPVASDIILDHVSASWGTDETLSITGSVDNVTIQWSIVSEGLLPHSCGSLLRPSVPCHMTFHHNLYANNRTRNPFACSYRDQANHCDWRNNVVYNGGDGHGGTNWHKTTHGLNPADADDSRLDLCVLAPHEDLGRELEVAAEHRDAGGGVVRTGGGRDGGDDGLEEPAGVVGVGTDCLHAGFPRPSRVPDDGDIDRLGAIGACEDAAGRTDADLPVGDAQRDARASAEEDHGSFEGRARPARGEASAGDDDDVTAVGTGGGHRVFELNRRDEEPGRAHALASAAPGPVGEGLRQEARLLRDEAQVDRDRDVHRLGDGRVGQDPPRSQGGDRSVRDGQDGGRRPVEGESGRELTIASVCGMIHATSQRG